MLCFCRPTAALLYYPYLGKFLPILLAYSSQFREEEIKSLRKIHKDDQNNTQVSFWQKITELQILDQAISSQLSAYTIYTRPQIVIN